jgi:hypothetical protein
MTKIVFHAFSAFVGSVTGRTTCACWPDDPSSGASNWSPAALVSVDLANTPKNGKTDVDDHTTNGGLTTIGPMFPGGQMMGACWLSETFIAGLPGNKPGKPAHAHDHELRAIVYLNDPQMKNRRFQGFHAKILGKAAGTGAQVLTRVQLWNAGTGKAGGPPAGIWWLDLDAIAHPIAPDATQIGPNTAQTDGALYLDTDQKQLYLASGGSGPKLPPGFGYGD